ncbi:hypothetical protein FOPG_18363 [Fusarium oxysporum f. sp. conglutinans race 2 54008]|uniref:Uncharacterized protein n=1 Tax=Fusarium oxysporum f. sp. conglutinans race 2 54008 TaxID=1089457 RepID=X0H011_FUSOX|nr:hypothetical protein FOPG_18363 [Fusarium oxysporum f. sp. conglutinans race 2 54008]
MMTTNASRSDRPTASFIDFPLRPGKKKGFP